MNEVAILPNVGLFNKRMGLFWSPETLSFSSKDCVGLTFAQHKRGIDSVGFNARNPDGVLDLAMVKSGDHIRVTNLLFNEWIKEQIGGSFGACDLAHACSDLVRIVQDTINLAPPYLFYSAHIDDPKSEINDVISEHNVTVARLTNPQFTKTCANDPRKRERFLRWVGVISKKDAAKLTLYGFSTISVADVLAQVPESYSYTDATKI